MTGYYCLECPAGTTTDNCLTVGGTCKVDATGVTPTPEYKKLRETHFNKIGSYHARGDVNPLEDGDLPGVDPVEGYKKVKYSYKGATVDNGDNEGDEGDAEGHGSDKGDN